MGVGERTATALAMIFHELATNSAKHGALSSAAGALEITGANDPETLTLVWAETGGPEIGESPDLAGFGSRMVLSNLKGQLGGSIHYDWQPTGLVASLTMRLSALPQ
jgi:two-component sensor histidine kinase